MSNNWKKIIVVLSVMVLFFAGGRVFAQSEGWKKIADKTNKDPSGITYYLVYQAG